LKTHGQLIVASALTLLFGGCSSLPEDLEQEPSYAYQVPKETEITKFFREAAPKGQPEKSGIRLLADPNEAYRARFGLSKLAQHTLDFQYYLWKNDATGTLLLERALEAADRGVQVRILIDDIYHRGRDPLYSKIATHPNAQIRVYNPSARRGLGSRLEMAFNMGTLNHRMHNKIFLVDNSIAVLGGRNIGDDYFGTDPNLNFHDLDAIAVGPIAAKAGEAFDLYWNSPKAIPVEALYPKGSSEEELKELRVKLENQREAHFAALSYPLPRNPTNTQAVMRQLRSELVWADAEIVVDDLARFQESRESEIFLYLRDLVRGADSELILQTAYLIPTDETIAGFKKLVDRGVTVKIMTNSLMSNNHVAVHAHYKKHRKALLKAGVELYELRADDALMQYIRDEATEFAESNAGLHTKAFVIDGSISVIGSYNMDPRSRVWNSEISLVVHDETIGGQMREIMETAMRPENAYRVVLNEQGKVRWELNLPDGKQVFRKEPGSGWWIRTKANLISWLPIGNQL